MIRQDVLKYSLVKAMSIDAEKIKSLVSFKQKLEKRVEELESELKELQDTLGAVNSILLEKGFKRAEITEKETSPPKEEIIIEHEPSIIQLSTEHESVTPLKTVAGEVLAILHVSVGSLKVLPAEDKNFNVNTPPFTHFLLQKVFAKMQEKDGELLKAGQLSPDKVFSYNIVREGDIIREIIVKNVDQERLRELKSSIRWTLEKMYEKVKG